MNQTKLNRIKSALRESIEVTDWLSNHNARTMTPLACKALLTAIEGLEPMVCDPSHGGEMCSNEGWGCDACEKARSILSSITSEWPDV